MKDADLNFKAEQLISEFEQANVSNPSNAWNSSLMQKIAAQPKPTSSGMTSTKISVIALLFVVLNLGFCIQTYKQTSTQTTVNRGSELTTISNELLIPATSTTN